MKVRIEFIFLLSIVQSSICVPIQAAEKNVNLVMNPSFEFNYTSTTYGKIPMYWSRLYGNADSLDLSTSKMDGERSFKLVDGYTNAPVGVLSDLIPVSSGCVYSARCWVRKSSSYVLAEVHLQFFDAEGEKVYGSREFVTGPSGDFYEYEVVATAPVNAVSARIFFYSNYASVGTVCFDGVSLTLADQMINDGDFSDADENGELPVHWFVHATHAGAIQDVQTDSLSGSKALRIYDNSSSVVSAAYYKFPVVPSVPYQLSAAARRVLGSGYARMILRFYDSDQQQITDCYATTYSTAYDSLAVTMTAPAGAVCAKAIFYIDGSGTGTAYFDDISFMENYTLKYASPAGAGDGSSYSTPASYTDSIFWSSTVSSAAASAPVKVVLLSGNYNSGNLRFDDVGDETNQIIIEGEKPFKTVFDGLYGARFFGTQNMTLRNVHFYSPSSENSAVVIGLDCIETKNITVDGCSFIGMTNVTCGVCSVAYENTYDVAIKNSTFIRSGKPSDGSHMIYNSADSYSIEIMDNYFQDGWGTYLKAKNGSGGHIITGNTFIENNGYRTNSSKPFIHVAAYNSQGEDHVLGTDFLIESNHFEYVNNSQCPIWIYVWGVTPKEHPGYHEIDAAEKSKIEGITNSSSSRNLNIVTNFGIDILNDWIIRGNSYSNTSPVKIRMDRSTPPAGFEWISADLSALIDE